MGAGGEKGIKFCLQEETKFGKQFPAPYTHTGGATVISEWREVMKD